MLFDSANIGESYSGIVSPLTSSFAKSIYKFVYTDLLVHSGVSIKRLMKILRYLVKWLTTFMEDYTTEWIIGIE